MKELIETCASNSDTCFGLGFALIFSLVVVCAALVNIARAAFRRRP